MGAVFRRNRNPSEIPPDEISLIDAGFGGMEEWRNFLRRDPSYADIFYPA